MYQKLGTGKRGLAWPGLRESDSWAPSWRSKLSWFESLHGKRFSRLAGAQAGCGAQSGSGVQSESGVLSGSEVQAVSCSNSTASCLHRTLRSWREAGDVNVAWNRTSIPLNAIMAWYLIDVTQFHICHFLYLTIFHDLLATPKLCCEQITSCCSDCL